MEDAYCKVCQNRHPGVAHVWAKTKAEAAQGNGALQPPADNSRDTGAPSHPVSQQPASASAPKPKFDRVAYQREYMVGWRARKKLEK